MKKDFITIHGEKFRVESNWNAIADFCRRKGIEDLSQIDVLAKIAVEDILTLIHCCISEGERMEGHDFGYTEMDLGGMINTAKMGEFMRIYSEQSSFCPEGEKLKKK